jgi:nucleotide-binding universal stress UspA family protein
MPATDMRKSETAPKEQIRNNARVRFRNILLATDFSPSAHLAMPFAGVLAQCFGAKLYAIHVAEPINYALPPEAWQEPELTRETELQSLARSIRHEFPDVEPEMIRAEGLVPEAVEAAVQKHDIDLVVIGTRGRTGVGKFLLGSKAEQILRHTTCPVVTVGPNVRSQARQPGPMRSIVFASDFGPASLAAAKYAVSVAAEWAGKVALLHVIEKREANDPGMPEDAVEASVQRLEALLPDDAELWCKPMVVVEHGQAAERILELAATRSADLIVLGVHAPEGVPGAATHLPRATVHKVIAHAECPVLTVAAKSPV